MSKNSTGSAHTQQHTDDVQAHYDLSNEFFALFQDPTRTYSCAYFPREGMTLHEAQLAKLDLTLGKLGLEPGMTLLDVGCGWGSTMKHAIEKYDVNVVGLTLSRNQVEHCRRMLDTVDTNRSHRVYLRDWGAFSEPVDRVVTIEALEHFGFERYNDFFKFAYNVLPADGVMLLHSITGLTGRQIVERGMPVVVRGGPLHQVHHDRHLPGWPSAVDREVSTSTRSRRVSTWPASSRCSWTSPGPLTSGPRPWRSTRTRPSRFSPKRSTTGI